MVCIYPFKNYRVLFTPLIGKNTYGNVVDVTQDIDLTDFIKSLGTIKREIDNGDYDIGIFTFGDITLNAINFSRKFNTPDDHKSIFKYRRDRCRVEVLFYDEAGASTAKFNGLINDDATRLDFEKNMVRFKVLSLDSIFRQVNVPAGAVVNGDLFSTAIKKILNVPEITSTFTYSAANITVDLDLAIDIGEYFSNIPAKTALDDLLTASNSILFVNNSDVLFVKPRTESAVQFDLYGAGDLYGRENILSIKEYNDGLHRSFSSVEVNDNGAVVTNDNWVIEYGFRQKSVTLDFITTLSKETQIAQNILDDFVVPKPELELTVKTSAVQGIQLLDMVSVLYDYRYAPSAPDVSVPMWGSAKWGNFRYPKPVGAYRILPKTKFKVIMIEEDPAKFTTTLKLRQTGTARHDGVFL